MEPFTAAEFMLLISTSPLNRNNNEENYRFNLGIAALDLSSRISVGIFSNPNQEYAAIVRRTLLRLDLVAYHNFFISRLHHFYELFLNSLYRLVGGRARLLDDDLLFEQLRNVELNESTDIAIRRYLTFISRNIVCIPADLKMIIFEEISMVLYRLNFEDSRLSYLLLKGTSFELPPSIFTHYIEPGRLDYILHHVQRYCHEIRRPDLFQFMKDVNSIIRCVKDGQLDFLEVVLKYGTWKSHCRTNVFSEMAIYFDNQVPNFNVVDYSTFRRFLAAQVYFTFADLNDFERHLSTLLLWWKSLPYPYIKAAEMEFAFIDHPIEMSSMIVVDMYRYRLCPGTLRPRSLRHQTRCAIRSFIDENSLLPGGIDALNVPRALRNYLKLKEPENQLNIAQVDE